VSCWALVALKAPAAAKGRLAETLTAAERSQLVGLMFDNVLHALRQARSIDGIAVVTAEPLQAEGVTVLDDPGLGLNEALTHAACELATRGISELLLLHADLPLVNGAEIDTMVAAGRRSGLAIAPDKLGQGTNALFITLPLQFTFRFGPRSFEHHLAEAALRQREATPVMLPGLAFDVDEPQDLARLLAEDDADYGFLGPALDRSRSA